jgi:checkpoint serine/threonine-protein kinase
MHQDLKKQHDAYRSRISSIQDEDDPLAVYVEFVNWTIKNNDPNSELPDLLTEATKAFQKDARYSSDLRYLKLWIQYAHRGAYPALSVFGYLYKQGIGKQYSLLYEEYAKLLEKEGKCVFIFYDIFQIFMFLYQA